MQMRIAMEERRILIAQRKLETIRLLIRALEENRPDFILFETLSMMTDNRTRRAIEQLYGVRVVSVATQVSDDNRDVRLIVQDNGEGIPKESRERVFDLLYSTKGSRGTGFGLAITKKLIEDHGGRITVRSELGQGTVFTLHLPLRTSRPSSGL